ncbi:hypothetical protein IJG72_02535 [bacterium]|nr:hypothetical protein [bacterium]
MGIDAVSGIQSYNSGAIGSISKIKGGLSEETVKKLKSLGIDPSKVKSEEEAQKIIKNAQNGQGSNVSHADSGNQSPIHVDIQKLRNDMKVLGEKIGVDVSNEKDFDKAVAKLEPKVEEYKRAASSQVNSSDHSQKVQRNDNQTKDDKKDIQQQFQDIKDRVDEIKSARNAMFAGQDMIGMLNKMALGLS